MVVTGGVSLAGGIIGGWAVVNGTDFATYLSPTSTLAINSGAAGVAYALGVSVDQFTAQEVNGSNVISVLSTAGFTVGEVVNGVGGLTNPTITAINAAADTITVSGNANATGSFTLSSNPFGAYSVDALTAGVPADNITIGASVGAVTNRTINSLRISAVSTATLNTLGDTLTIGTSGFLANGAASVLAGGRVTAGSPINTAASFYEYANNTVTNNSVIANNGTGVVTFVKSGGSTVTENVLPTVWTTSTTSAQNTVTVGKYGRVGSG